MASQALAQGQQANLASSLAAAASQRGNQNPGMAQKQIGEQRAAINAGAAGTAAKTAAQQQLNAQGADANLSGIQANVNLANASSQNAMTQFNQQSAQAGNAAQQAQYQYANSLAAAQQAQENSALVGFQAAAQQQGYTTQNAVAGGAMNAGGAAITNAMSGNNGGNNNGGVNLSDSTMGTGSGTSPTDLDSSATGTGGPVGAPTITTVGEKGPELAKLAPGSEIIPLDGTPNTGAGLHPMAQHANLLEALTHVATSQAKRISDLEMALKGGRE
jgi:hypothetical protein